MAGKRGENRVERRGNSAVYPLFVFPAPRKLPSPTSHIMNHLPTSIRIYSSKKLNLLALLDLHSETVNVIAFRRLSLFPPPPKCINNDEKNQTYVSDSIKPLPPTITTTTEKRSLFIAGSKDSKISLWSIY